MAKFKFILGWGILFLPFAIIVSCNNTKIERAMFPANGTYYIAPYVKEKDSENPTRIRTSGGKTDYITITVDDDDINGEGENEEPIEVVSEWSEDFENRIIPSSWKQEVELGISEWDARYVLMASDELPAASHGKGYVYINYATGLDLYNSRTVTRLVTPIISLAAGTKYNLSFQSRKHSTLPESTDILTIYYKKGKEWIPISEVAVTNQGDWRKTSVELPIMENIQLAFEGSPARGSSIFLDDIRIYDRKNEISAIPEATKEALNGSCWVYSLTGILIGKWNNSDIQNLSLPQGSYIIRSSNKVKKIHIR